MTSASQTAAKAATGPWSERLARLGLAARGILYVVLGILALRIALGKREKANQQGALQEVVSQPFGKVLIWVVAVGLVGYALWRLTTAALGTRADPTADKASARVKALPEGIGYGAVAFAAVKIAASGGSSGAQGGKGAKGFTAQVLGWPAGQWLVGAAGAVVVAAGLYFAVDGWRADFTKELSLGKVGPTMRKIAVQLGRIGRIARGAAFTLIGGLLIAAAVTYDAAKAKGLDGALKTLAGEPYGRWLLGAIALGFVAYGLYGLLESRLRRVS